MEFLNLDKNRETEINSKVINNEVSQSLLTEQNDLLRRNLKVSEEILKKTEAIKNYIKWQKIWSTIRLLIILIPLIIGFLFLPPLIKNYIDQFSSFYK